MIRLSVCGGFLIKDSVYIYKYTYTGIFIKIYICLYVFHEIYTFILVCFLYIQHFLDKIWTFPNIIKVYTLVEYHRGNLL